MDKSVQLSAAPAGLHGRVFSASQIPDRSGFPSAVFGAGAPRFGNPAGVVGTPAVGYFIHCARSGYNIRVNNVCPGFAETQMVAGALATLPPADAQAFAATVEVSKMSGTYIAPAAGRSVF